MDNQTIDQMDNRELKFVHQFLIHHNFENTADALMIEAKIKGFKDFKTDLKTKDEIYEYYYEQIMLSYRNGDWKAFFKLWNLLIPENAMQTKACKILIMEQLRNFLNTTGKELENEPELRVYFALPFIEDPYTEPFLSKIFEQSWTDEMTENLQVLLETYKPQIFSDIKYTDENSNKFPSNYTPVSEKPKSDIVANKTINSNNIPIIPNDRNIPMFLEDGETDEQYNSYGNIKYSQKSKSIQTVSMNSSEEDMYSSHFTKKNKKLLQCTQELAVAKSHLCSVHSNYEKVKIRFHKLHTDYHKLMNIAKVLTTALENSIKGQVIDFQDILESCIKIFPDLFNQNVKDTSHFSSELLLDKSRSDINIIEYSESYSTFVPPKLLDFKKIKLHLINGSMKTKLFLLQALRRKITFSQPGERDETVREYISKDLLGLHSQIVNYKGKSILPYLLTPQNVVIPHPLQQSIMRLLNTLASFRCGRDYLSFDSTVVDMVFKCLNSTCDINIDTLTCNMIIAMLQKLSLRKQQRIYMIENGLVEWLIRHLHNQYRIMDSYRLEYATALLMNLSLHQVAQKRASAMASLLISTLIDLLLMDHAMALPYINGTLNNFLTNHVINEEAKKMKFSAVLEQYSKYKTGEIRKHLNHIMRIHRGEITIKMEDEQMIDNDNEQFDVLENQLDENDPVKNNYAELCGESLLESCYTISSKIVQKKEIISDVASFAELKPDTINAVQNNQVKNLYSQHELIGEENLSRKSINKKHDIRNKSSDMVIEDFVKKVVPYSKLQLHATELKSSSIKDRQISKKQIMNDKWNLIDKISIKKAYNESATYLYENQIAKESSKTIVASSVLLGIGSAAESTVTEKISSIASLNIEGNDKIANDSIPWSEETELDTEEAFLAKPKLLRTPP
ncbi:LisH domain-containing protein ARMC9 [Habropoda laboriosa]|uniref:LisH domain-containing protein ARMC9 n=1 Tax=Habropoda laboriosa TaxID=597456 RepID=A0A0L7R367_9HYME|nr:LisH domain-containing protein ARMC9 [Habropoda laboriosa]